MRTSHTIKYALRIFEYILRIRTHIFFLVKLIFAYYRIRTLFFSAYYGILDDSITHTYYYHYRHDVLFY